MRIICGGYILLLLFLLISCGGNASGTNIWIDAPLNNITLTGTQPISIEGHASSPAGISKIEITINGEIVESINTPTTAGNLSEFQMVYNPTGPGEYVIEAIATSNDDEISSPDFAIVTIAEAIAAYTEVPDQPEITVTPTLVPTHTEVPAPAELQVNFWADPSTVQAGNCSTLHWEVSNALDVVFGGISREFIGSDSACICEESTYPLTVTSLDGITEVYRVTIEVTGVCATSVPPTNTPTPVPDTVGPPPPTQLKPINNVELGCVPDVMLRWEAAYDPSGIAEYQIEVQRHPGDNNWQPVSGSVFTGITELEHLLTVECGYIYRWRIRAIDGLSNTGNWSDWFTFTIPLS